METKTTETQFCKGRLGKIIFLRVFSGAMLAVLFFLLSGFVVQWLWNKTVAPLFSTPAITYWQSVGIIILSRILFFGCGRGSHSPFNPRKFHEHMRNMHRRYEDFIGVGGESLQGYVERMAHYHGCKRPRSSDDQQKDDV